jgi:glutathione synthase/RimK-type ligase-like ATP-grasp enzyme
MNNGLLARGRETLRTAREVARATGKSVPGQLLEILRLRFGPGCLGPADYYALDLFDDSLDFEAKSRFVGWRMSAEIDKRLNAASSRILANDKIVNYQLLAALGYLFPRTLATYRAAGPAIGSEVRLPTHDAVRAFLRDAGGPVFAKPVVGTYGRGAMAIAAYDSRRAMLRFLDGTEAPEDRLLRQLEFPPFNGFLFQELVRPHSAIVDVAGPAVSCVRVGVLSDPEPAVHFAFWKIATRENVTDNFSRGATGNLLGAIDMATGAIKDVVATTGPHRLRAPEHPTTRRPLVGFQIPMWSEVLDVSTSAARHFPGLRLQNWDVVVTDEGPLLMELNTEADLFAVNLLSRVGLLDGRLGDIMAAGAHRRA